MVIFSSWIFLLSSSIIFSNFERSPFVSLLHELFAVMNLFCYSDVFISWVSGALDPECTASSDLVTSVTRFASES